MRMPMPKTTNMKWIVTEPARGISIEIEVPPKYEYVPEGALIEHFHEVATDFVVYNARAIAAGHETLSFSEWLESAGFTATLVHASS